MRGQQATMLQIGRDTFLNSLFAPRMKPRIPAAAEPCGTPWRWCSQSTRARTLKQQTLMSVLANLLRLCDQPVLRFSFLSPNHFPNRGQSQNTFQHWPKVTNNCNCCLFPIKELSAKSAPFRQHFCPVLLFEIANQMLPIFLGD